MKERILILGAGFLQGPAIRIAQDLGLEVTAVDGNPDAPCAAWADRFEAIDLKDKERIEALARKLKALPGGLSGVMTCGTDFSAPVAWVAERLGLPGIPYEAALAASDKALMRRVFADAGVPSPAFTVCGAPPEAPPAFGFPVVVKPCDNMGGRGCRKAGSLDALRCAVSEALPFSRSGRVIVEEYMDGPEFSADALVYDGKITLCGLADRHIFFPPYFVEMGHTMPTNLEAGRAEALCQAFYQGIRALGITRGAAKGDLKLTAKGPMIGEIAARLSGGFMSGWTYPYSSGVEPIRGAIRIAIGRDPGSLAPTRAYTSAERAFISLPGKIRAIEGVERARAVPGLREFSLRVSAGSRVSFPENNVSKCGNAVSCRERRDDAIFAAEEAARRVLIRLEAPDPETAAFLAKLPSQAPTFPPDAFSVSWRCIEAVSALPPEAPDLAERIARGEKPLILEAAEVLASGARDIVGRGVEESLESVRALTGLALPLTASPGGAPAFARGFWQALLRGGYQGAAYLVDLLGAQKDP
ncbi:MAG: ATP-grasp domain-containing protein [Treponema sp.]|jgi:biotin carboxylase|nr:ATP-grasp domain-containing protein [Treponema sp.]